LPERLHHHTLPSMASGARSIERYGFPTWSSLIAFPFQGIVQFHEFRVREFAS
jgi:hypothetical protein